MRVLYVNGREDADRIPGGDSIQMEKTRQALLDLNVEIEVRSPFDLDHLPAFDLAHIFNIQMPETTWQVYEFINKRGIPFVLSPIYWDMYEYWAEEAISNITRWTRLSRLLGKDLVRKLYVSWQYLKGPSNRTWRLQRRLLQSAYRVLPNSYSESIHLQHSFWLNGSFQNNVDIVPNAIDADLYRTQPEPSQEFVQKYGFRDFVLEVGTIYPVKNQLGLLKALQDVPIPIVFIGQVMESRSDYARACKDLALQRKEVLFLDRVDHSQLRNIYALAAVHALPSWRETPGLVSLEAAAAGSNVVTTSIGSTYDYFADQAFYCHPGNPGSIRDAVVMALNTKPDGALRNRVLKEYSWQRAAQATLGAYNKALNSI